MQLKGWTPKAQAKLLGSDPRHQRTTVLPSRAWNAVWKTDSTKHKQASGDRSPEGSHTLEPDLVAPWLWGQGEELHSGPCTCSLSPGASLGWL